MFKNLSVFLTKVINLKTFFKTTHFSFFFFIYSVFFLSSVSNCRYLFLIGVFKSSILQIVYSDIQFQVFTLRTFFVNRLVKVRFIISWLSIRMIQSKRRRLYLRVQIFCGWFLFSFLTFTKQRMFMNQLCSQHIRVVLQSVLLCMIRDVLSLSNRSTKFCVFL